MTHEILIWLWRGTLTASVAICAVLALRVVVRRSLGAQAAYTLWLLVPMAVLAMLLPAPERPLIEALRVAPVLVAAAPAIALSAPAESAHIDPRPWLLAIWIFGAIAMLAALAWQQRRYLRALGPLAADGHGALRAQGANGSPALVGALFPRIVLPADFEARFDERERELVLAHEHAHLGHGDAQVNALVALLRCVQWFNPLLHFAASRLRIDQELACDARVIARFPEARRPYADAMLKAQLIGEARQELRLPIGCYWPSSHPLKERISMLKLPVPTRMRRALASAVAMVLALGAGYASWAAQPAGASASDTSLASASASKESIGARIVFAIDGEQVFDTLGYDPKRKRQPSDWQVDLGTFDLLLMDSSAVRQDLLPILHSGDRVNFIATRGNERWNVDGVVSASGDDTLNFVATISHNGAVVSKPSLLMRNGEPGSLQLGKSRADGKFEGVRLDLMLRRVADAQTVAKQTRGARRDAADGPPTEAIVFRKMYPPKYPPEAVKMGAGADVVLKVLVGADGSPKSADVDKLELVGKPKPLPDGTLADWSPLKDAFAKVSIAAAMSWKYTPGMHNGEPFEGYMLVPINYSLQDDDAPAANLSINTKAPSYRRMRPPSYPKDALSQHVAGTVWLRARVGADGRIDNIDLEDAKPAAARTLAPAAIAAVKDWTFNPEKENARPVAADIIVPLEFTIEGQAAPVVEMPVSVLNATQLAKIKVVGKPQ